MLNTLITLSSLAILALVLWFMLRIYLPVNTLSKMAKRVASGERVHAWEVNGPHAIRTAAKSLEELSIQFQFLHQSNENTGRELEALFTSINEGAVIVGKDGIVKLYNPAFREMFSIRESLEGKRLLDLIQIFEVNEVVSQCLKSRQVESDSVSFQAIQSDYMQMRNYQLLATPLQNSEGNVFGSMLVVADYSRVKEMESLEQQMVASVSHELRTPLSVFKGYLEVLVSLEADGSEETRRILGVLTRHSNRLNQLVEDLLILSRVEAQSMDPLKEPVKVAKLFQKVIEDAQHFLVDGIQVEFKIESAVDVVYMDAFRMEQVFHNLIDNAQRHSESSKKILIGVKRDGDSGTCHFYVQDEGMGIPSDKLPLIFNRFYRVDRARSRERGGTGLGLAIVREIVRSHGGDAWAESNLGEGTTIWFSIPDPHDVDETVG
jgi:two-component system phosphate regulon sensor histidine kinase PhoR